MRRGPVGGGGATRSTPPAVGSPAPSSATLGDGGDLADTGVRIGAWLVLAVALLGAGVLMTSSARRRPTHRRH